MLSTLRAKGLLWPAVATLAGVWIDREHSGAKDEAAGADSRRLVMPVMLPQIEPGTRRSNYFAHGSGSEINPKAVPRLKAEISRHCLAL